MASTIVRPSDFDSTQVTFAEPKTMDSGAKQVYLNYDGRALQTQTASMAMPYGLNVYDKAGPTTYSVDLSFRGTEEDPKLQSFYDMLVQFDEMMVEAGIKNCVKWFKMKDASREVIKAFYTPSIKVSLDRDGKPKPYPPTFKVKLPKKNGAFEAQFYDSEKRPYEGVTVDELLVKGARATILIKCTGVWFAGSKFGVTWKAIQVRMDSVPASIGRSCAILDDEDSAPAPRARAAAGGGRAAPAPAGNRFAAVDDDDDGDVVDAVLPTRGAPVAATVDDEDDEEDVVEAPPLPKKASATAAAPAGGAKKVVKRAGAK
uniref:Uncharacterized protein n=1 Tax=viral metagenome TaxID=1070528 RepID=A0A6C0DVP8_9ZZZZ